MFKSVILNLLLNLFSLIIVTSSFANPFSAKSFASKETKSKGSLIYKGNAIISGTKFAIVEYGNEDAILKKGDRLEHIKIIKFSEESLTYQVKGQLYKVLKKNIEDTY